MPLDLIALIVDFQDDQNSAEEHRNQRVQGQYLRSYRRTLSVTDLVLCVLAGLAFYWTRQCNVHAYGAHNSDKSTYCLEEAHMNTKSKVTSQ